MTCQAVTASALGMAVEQNLILDKNLAFNILRLSSIEIVFNFIFLFN